MYIICKISRCNQKKTFDLCSSFAEIDVLKVNDIMMAPVLTIMCQPNLVSKTIIPRQSK